MNSLIFTSPQEQPAAQPLDLSALIEQLQKSPKLASALASLIANQTTEASNKT